MDSFGTLLSSYNNERQICRRMLMIGMEAEVAIKVIGFYLCLESIGGHPNVIKKIASQNNMTISLLAAEALAALAQIYSDEATVPSYTHLPFISSIASRDFTLLHFYINRQSFRDGVSLVLDGICDVIFMDILDETTAQAQAQAQAQAHARAEGQARARAHTPSLESVGLGLGRGPVRPSGEEPRKQRAIQSLAGLLGYPMFSPLGGPLSRSTLNLRAGFTAGFQSPTIAGLPNQTNLNPTARPWSPFTTRSQAPIGERTLFVTFSIGDPLTEDEIYRYFTGRFGDCVESVYVNRQNRLRGLGPSLFGKVVFRSASTITYLMNGHEVIKLTVAGKPLWGRRFDSRHQGRWRRMRS